MRYGAPPGNLPSPGHSRRWLNHGRWSHSRILSSLRFVSTLKIAHYTNLAPSTILSQRRFKLHQLSRISIIVARSCQRITRLRSSHNVLVRQCAEVQWVARPMLWKAPRLQQHTRHTGVLLPKDRLLLEVKSPSSARVVPVRTDGDSVIYISPWASGKPSGKPIASIEISDGSRGTIPPVLRQLPVSISEYHVKNILNHVYNTGQSSHLTISILLISSQL